MPVNREKRELMVVFGGRSGEHEVSLLSAVNVMKAAAGRYRVTPVGILRDGTWRALTAEEAEGVDAEDLPARAMSAGRPCALAPTPAGAALLDLSGEGGAARSRVFDCGPSGAPRALCRPDAVFPVLHGTFGEDGTIQGLFEMCGVPYVGPGVLGSGVCMDKATAKRVLRDAGLPVVEFVEWRRGEAAGAAVKAVERGFGYPAFVKPANLGSSVGISKARDRRSLVAALGAAGDYDRKVLIERAVDAREIECAVLGNSRPRASVPGEVIPINEFYDYEAKYEKEGSRTVVPARIPAGTAAAVRAMAVKAFVATGCEGMARVDFFLERGTGEIYVNELNTIPGFTRISMYPMMWKACGISFPTLVDRLVTLAVRRHVDVARNRTDCKKM
jgi:D-alanine-D-alanine ligase